MPLPRPTTLGLTILALWTCLLGGCGKFPSAKTDDSSIQETKTKPYQLLGSIEDPFELSSEITGLKHRIRIYLPKGYQNSGRNYPVLYMTDAQWAFAFYAETLDWKNKEVILVGVEQESTYRRMADFSPLGAPKYLRFFKQELIPAIEKKYRVNRERTFMGVSLGALFGAILLCDEPVGPPFFKSYLLFDGSFNLLTSEYLQAEATRFSASNELNVRLILTGATPGNAQPASAFADRYRKRGYQGLEVTFKAYAIAHEGIAAPSFGDFIDTVYPSKP